MSTPTLTPINLFYEERRAELESTTGRKRLPITEVVDIWQTLSEEEKSQWEEKAAAAQKAYLEECTKRALERLEAEENGEEEEEEEEEQEEEEEDAQEDGEEEDAGETSGFDGPPRLPAGRVKRIAQAGTEVGIVSKEMVFACSKAAELFVEKVLWATTKIMPTNRSRIDKQHLNTALRTSSTPEAFQYFLEELQPAPPAPPEPPPRGNKKKAQAAKSSASKPPSKEQKNIKRKAKDESDAVPQAEAEAPPAKRRGRPPRAKAADEAVDIVG